MERGRMGAHGAGRRGGALTARSVRDSDAMTLLKGEPTGEKTCRRDCPSWIGG